MNSDTGFKMILEQNLAQVLGKWLHHWKLIFVGVGVPTLLTIILCMNAQRIYTAEQTLVIAKGSSKGASSLLSAAGMGDVASLIGLGAGSELNQLKILSQSNVFALKCIAKFKLDTVWYPEPTKPIRHEDLVKKWLSQFTYTASDEDGVQIQWRDHNPQRASDVVRYSAFWLDSAFQSLQRSTATANLNFIEKRVAERKGEIESLEDSISDFLKIHKTFSPDIEIAQSAKKMALMDAELEKIDLEMTLLQKSDGSEGSAWKSLAATKAELEKRIREISSGSVPRNGNGRSGNIAKDLDLKIQFTRLTRNAERHGAVYKFLIQQEEMLAIDAQKNVPLLFSADSVLVPEKKSSPKTMVITQLVFFCSLLLTLAGILFKGAAVHFVREVIQYSKAQA